MSLSISSLGIVCFPSSGKRHHLHVTRVVLPKQIMPTPQSTVEPTFENWPHFLLTSCCKASDPICTVAQLIQSPKIYEVVFRCICNYPGQLVGQSVSHSVTLSDFLEWSNSEREYQYNRLGPNFSIQGIPGLRELNNFISTAPPKK